MVPNRIRARLLKRDPKVAPSYKLKLYYYRTEFAADMVLGGLHKLSLMVQIPCQEGHFASFKDFYCTRFLSPFITAQLLPILQVNSVAKSKNVQGRILPLLLLEFAVPFLPFPKCPIHHLQAYSNECMQKINGMKLQ